MDPTTIDQIRLNSGPEAMIIINMAIGFMMLGVSLDINFDNFKRVFIAPKAPLIGLITQFVFLPAFTFLLTLIIRPTPSIALGMILVAACPGGNLSNIMTYLAKGNCVLSISMTAISSIAAIFMTPLNLSLWGNLNPYTADILRTVNLSPMDVFATVFLILGIPLAAGQILQRFFPNLSTIVRKPFKIFSLIFFVVIVCGALSANFHVFAGSVGIVMIAVFIHNAMALNIGYWCGRLTRLPERDCRALSIEVGIQNSALGLVLVFNFFSDLGGMAILVAWWGLWHIISGLAMVFIFTRRNLPDEQSQTAGSRLKGVE
ncbi:MAG: bile acid:sodium symporter family protein [Desulfobacteraceae bacterium]|nr:bile acid:sodium symporter family protein [Desulfobacteraceae bacterium]